MISHYLQRLRQFLGAAIFPICFLLLNSTCLVGQEAVEVAVGPDGQPMQISPAQPDQGRHGRHGPPGAPPGAPPNGQPAEAKPDDKNKKDGDADKKKDEPPTTVKRPEKPPRVPDPREFAVKVDAKGQVPPFNFIGQPWPDVMQWLATISKCSLDWQELPNDYLNLTTQRAYSVDEVRDLINRHLNARGFTSVQSGEVLSVFKIDKLDPSLVRRVSEDQLYDLKPYDFVKVSFELPEGMEVDKAKEDVKQLLNPAAKIFPLVASKRLLVMDSVANLRTVSEMLNQERMIKDGRIVPKEFVLKYARPEKVIDILYVVLGMDPKSRPTQMDLQLQQQKLQLMTQMQQRGTDVSKMLKQDGPPVYLAYNRQRNSVLANAPPELMKVIEQTISYLDVPFGGADGNNTAGATGSNQRVMKKYPLTNLDPEKFVSTLEEIGGLSPSAEFKVDDDSKSLFAMASEADQARINSLIDQFDGTGRQFEVIQLRRLPADAVAASINNLMGGQNEKEETNRRRSPWDFDFYGEREDTKKKKPIKGFGVDADIEHNRILLWANEVEMKRVRDLLVKLGEIPGGQPDARPVRMVAPTDPKDTAALLERLRAAWPTSGANQLIIKGPPAKAPSTSEPPKTDKPAAEPTTKATTDRATQNNAPGRVAARFAELNDTAAAPATENLASNVPAVAPSTPTNDKPAPTVQSAQQNGKQPTPPPITVTVTDDGRLMLSSPDTAALDRLEDVIDQISPPDKRFKVFPCNHIRASEMWYDLTDFFKDDLEEKSGNMIRDWNGFLVPTGSSDKPGGGLSKRRKLMITYDRPSNSILVANASATQLGEIQQLIEQFDVPASADSVEIRQTAAIKIRFSKPSVIAAAVKEVYRDLLSSRDKEFDRGDKREERSRSERVTVINYGGSADNSSSTGRPSPIKVGFDGALSMGADDVSGVLIVSAQKGIFDDIVRMVRELDNQAAPQTTVQVHHLNGNVSAAAVQKALDKAVGNAWLGNRPEQQPNQTGQEGDKKHGQNDKNRNERHRDNGNNGNGGNDE